MSNSEPIFNLNEYLSKTELVLSQEHKNLLKQKAQELGLDFETILEIVIANYYPITQEDIDKYEELRLIEKQEQEGL
jgi:hypothetical protein